MSNPSNYRHVPPHEVCPICSRDGTTVSMLDPLCPHDSEDARRWQAALARMPLVKGGQVRSEHDVEGDGTAFGIVLGIVAVAITFVVAAIVVSRLLE